MQSVNSNANKTLQLRVYFKKYIRIFFNSHRIWKVIDSFIITGLVLLSTSEQAFIRYEETRTTAFAIVCACIWIGIFNSIEVICSERNSIRQEHKSGNIDYSVFLGAHMLVEFLLCFVEAIIVSALVLLMHGLRLRVGESLDFFRIILMFVSIFLIIYASDMLGLMISSFVKSNKDAMTIMPFALIVQLVLSDFIFELEGWKKILSNFTFAKWGLRALGISIDFNTMSTSLSEAQSAGYGEETLETINRFLALTRQKNISEYSAAWLNILMIFGILILFIVVQALIARWALTRIDQDTR